MTDVSSIGQDTFKLMPNRRTFIQGMSEIIDFSKLQNHYVISDTERDADTRAIAADWIAVGRDLKIAYVWGREQAISK
jgi:TolB-like protein